MYGTDGSRHGGIVGAAVKKAICCCCLLVDKSREGGWDAVSSGHEDARSRMVAFQTSADGGQFSISLSSIPVAVVWRGQREAEATRQARMYGVEGRRMGWPRDQSRTGRGVGFNAGLGRALKVWVASGVLACGGQSLSFRELRE